MLQEDDCLEFILIQLPTNGRPAGEKMAMMGKLASRKANYSETKDIHDLFL